MAEKQYTVDPDRFDEAQWVELCTSTNGFVPPNDDRTPVDLKQYATAFEATETELRAALAQLAEKEAQVRAGVLGDVDDDEVDPQDWADVLEATAAVLEDILEGR